jgi:hypothetical protein
LWIAADTKERHARVIKPGSVLVYELQCALTWRITRASKETQHDVTSSDRVELVIRVARAALAKPRRWLTRLKW